MAVWKAQSLIRGIEIEPPVIWLERLAQQSSSIVSRTLLQTKESYRQYIDGLVQDGHTTLTPKIEQRLDNMPEHIWVSEITLPHLYTGNKHKLGGRNHSQQMPLTKNILQAKVLSWPGYLALYILDRITRLFPGTYILMFHL